jgi:hypothetical protein
MIRIEVPMLPPRALGPNASRRMHWGQKARIKTEWQSAVYYAGVQYRDVMLERARLKITCIIKDRRSVMDADNALAACKPAIDMLTARVRGANPGRGDPGRQGLCIIVDDSPSHLEICLPVVYTIDKARAPLTVFEIEGR